MHICFIIGAMNYSGAEKVLSMIADGLHKKQNKVSIVLLEKDAGVRENLDGIETYGAKSTGNKINRILKRWNNIRTAVKTIDPEIVVSFGSVCNVNTVPALSGLSYPLILCERNDPVYDPRKKSEKLIRWILYRFADGYVFQTERIKKYFSERIQKKSIVIENPISPCSIKWELTTTKKRIATVARLDDFQKDHIVMFKAFQQFHKNHADYILDVFGDGPDRKKYESLIEKIGMKDAILLHGKSENPLKDIVNDEIFLLTSKYEGMPNALMEAMAIGMPCIATDCGGGGAKALFELTGSGILVQVGNVNAIAEALDSVSKDDSLKRSLSNTALNINECLDTRRIVEKWEIYLQTVLNKKKK